MTQEGVNGVIVLEQNENWTFRQLIIDLAEKARLPTIWPATEGVEIGGFMSYGIDWQDIGRRIAGATDQILKGKNPNDIPIQQPTAFHLSINLKTAKTLGIGIPSSVLIQADKVIECGGCMTASGQTATGQQVRATSALPPQRWGNRPAACG